MIVCAEIVGEVILLILLRVVEVVVATVFAVEVVGWYWHICLPLLFWNFATADYWNQLLMREHVVVCGCGVVRRSLAALLTKRRCHRSALETAKRWYWCCRKVEATMPGHIGVGVGVRG